MSGSVSVRRVGGADQLTRVELQAVEVYLQDVEETLRIDLQIQVNQDIAQACPAFHGTGKRGIEGALLAEYLKGLAIGGRGSPTTLGDQMVGQVERALGSEL